MFLYYFLSLDVSELKDNDDKFELYHPDNGYTIYVVDSLLEQLLSY